MINSFNRSSVKFGFIVIGCLFDEDESKLDKDVADIRVLEINISFITSRKNNSFCLEKYNISFKFVA